MALRLSTGLRNACLDNGINGRFNSGVLEIRSGSQPAAANDAPSGTLLASISLPADCFAAASAGAIAKNGTWQDASADATGTAGWFRFRTTSDGGGSSTTDERLDGSCTGSGGGGDMEFDSTSIVAAGTVTINTYTITQPAS